MQHWQFALQEILLVLVIKLLTIFILVNEIGNAQCRSNLKTNTAVLLQKQQHTEAYY